MSVWAFSDIHGQRDLFDQVMAKIGPEDKVFFLGDAIDRGPDGWAILKELINNPRVTYIKGNHEDMMCNALRYFPNYSIWSRDMQVWDWNGNTPTLEAIDSDDENTVKNILQKVNNLPVYATYTNQFGDIFWLSHAGCDYTKDGLDSLSYEDLIWDRNHFISNKWFHDDPDNLYIVHGHTPIPLLLEEMSMYNDDIPRDGEVEPGAYYYAGGHKIDIDCGAHFTGVTVLLNLDTFEEYTFGMTE